MSPATACRICRDGIVHLKGYLHPHGSGEHKGSAQSGPFERVCRGPHDRATRLAHESDSPVPHALQDLIATSDFEGATELPAPVQELAHRGLVATRTIPVFRVWPVDVTPRDPE